MKNSLFISALFFSLLSFAQVKQADTYKMIKYDSSYGITMYEKLNFYLGGDSVRYDKKGYSASGWYEDYYDGGQVLHKGYYVEGHLKVYKNFYEHGQLEREFKSEFNKATLSTFFGNGKPHAQIEYLAGNVIKETDYFENGQIEFTEEYDKDGVYIKREFYYENGKPQSILALVDAKKKLFSSKEYFVNGNIKEEGQIHYSKAIGDFQKEGKWLVYNEQGKVVAEQFFSKGEMSNENKF